MDPNHAAVNMSSLSGASYMAASKAAELGTLSAPERAAERAALARARDTLAASLATRAPAWPQFCAQVAELSASLGATQKASTLAKDTVALAAGATPGDPGRPRGALDALRDSQRVASDLALLSRVRSVAEQIGALRDGDRPPMASSAGSSALAAVQPATHEARSMPGDARAPDFMSRARQVAAARAAASDDVLGAVVALEPIREELRVRHSDMREELETLLVQGVYGVPQCEDDTRSCSMEPLTTSVSRISSSKLSSNNAGVSADALSVTSSFLPQLPITCLSSGVVTNAKPEPAGFLPLPISVQDALPQIAQALDTLCGEGRASDVVKAAAKAQAMAVVEHAMQTEFKLAENNRDPVDPTSGKARRFAFFTAESQSFVQKVSCAVINRVSYHYLATLRRVNALAMALEKDGVKFSAAVEEIHEQEVCGFELVLDGLLRSNLDGGTLLDSALGRFNVTMAHSGSNWSNSKGDLRESSHSLISSEELSIYNLELVHGVVRRFIAESARLITTVMDSGQRPTEQAHVRLNSLLTDLTDSFMRTLRHDIRLVVRGVVGNRAGSLLQPPPIQSEPNANGAVPPPQHVMPLAHVMAVCLRIGISMPEIAQQVGSAVAFDVLATLNQRSKEALKLASQWTDAGKLSEELTYGAGIPDEGETNISARSDLKRAMPLHRIRSREVSRVLAHFNNVLGTPSDRERVVPLLLSRIEWGAIVRLVFGLNTMIDEIRIWCGDLETCQSGLDGSFVPRWSAPMASSDTSNPLSKLRLKIGKGCRGNELALVSTVCAVIRPIERAINTLDADVIRPAVALLRAETMLRCYSLVIQSLEEVVAACESPARARKAARKEAWRTVAATFVGESFLEEAMSSSGDDTSSRLYEFDEYGDRIPQSNTNSAVKEAFGGNGSTAKSLTIAENRMVRSARDGSIELSSRFSISRSALSATQQDEISSGVDAAIAAGLRSVRRRDRATAVAGHILLQAVSVENELFVGERCAEQCRSLMYEAGMIPRGCLGA